MSETRCHTSGMDSYSITPDDKGGVSVQVLYGNGVIGIHWFKTEAEARAWVVTQRTEAPDRSERHKAGHWPI